MEENPGLPDDGPWQRSDLHSLIRANQTRVLQAAIIRRTPNHMVDGNGSHVFLFGQLRQMPHVQCWRTALEKTVNKEGKVAFP